MNLLKENIIPGNHGKVFGTNAKYSADLERIKAKIVALKGVEKVDINFEIFPKEFTIYTSKLIPIKEIEEIVMNIGFHAIPKSNFEL
jgi:hypothetical protein